MLAIRSLNEEGIVAKAKVGVIMGSESDLEIIMECIKLLKLFDVNFEVDVTSAHRSPKKTHEYAKKAAQKGFSVIIAAAGGSAHLAGVIAAETTLPIIAIPVPSSALCGVDALLSTVQMPKGVPVATMGIGQSGAANAALLAIQILSLSDAPLRKKLHNFKKELADRVSEVSEKTKKNLEKIIEKI